MGSELKHNLFSGIPTSLPHEMFNVLLQNDHLKIERIVSKGQASEPGFWYDQDQSEWVLVLQGAAQLEFEDHVLELQVGDYVNIEAHQKRRVKWTTPDQETVWLAIFYEFQG
jgi:cupin 2 domain-containing protein